MNFALNFYLKIIITRHESTSDDYSNVIYSTSHAHSRHITELKIFFSTTLPSERG